MGANELPDDDRQAEATAGRGDRVGSLANVDHVLTTERLVLRPVTAHDHAVLLTHWALPDVRRFLFDGEALSAAEVTETIEDSTRDFAAAGYGVWLIHEEGRSALVG